jgi:hypothetical protein
MKRTTIVSSGSTAPAAVPVDYTSVVEQTDRTAIPEILVSSHHYVPEGVTGSSAATTFGQTIVGYRSSATASNNLVEKLRATLSAMQVSSQPESFADTAAVFVAQRGASAIEAFTTALSAEDFDNLRWQLANILAEDRNPQTQLARRNLLLEMLGSRNAGDRAAAASAIGIMGDRTLVGTLKDISARETSKLVRSIIAANIRSLQGNDTVAATVP